MMNKKNKHKRNILYNLLSNNYFTRFKRWYMLVYYKGCLRETLIRIIRGEKGLELARRFFNYKIYQLQSKQNKKDK